jgi:peptidyl-prolyl cis-trans isomerase C
MFPNPRPPRQQGGRYFKVQEVSEMKKFILVFVVAAVALACSGCAGKDDKAPSAAPSQGQAKPAEAVGDVVAVVGEHVVPMSAYNIEVEKLPQQHRQWTTTPQGKRYIVDSLVEGYLVDDEAKRRGLDKRADINAKLENYRRQVLKDALLEDALKSDQPVTDADVEKYYKDHPAEFKQPEKVKVMDMVLKDETGARSALARVSRGEDFAKVAKEMSVDAFTRDRGGDIPEFYREMRPDLYEQAAAAKKPGQMIGPVKTGSGFHVMKFVKRVPPEEKTYDQVKDSLKARLQAIRRQETYMAFIKSLREAARVTVNDEWISGPKAPEAPKPSPAPAAQPAPPKGK